MNQNSTKGINAKRATVIFFVVLLIGAVAMIATEFLGRLSVAASEEIAATGKQREIDAARVTLTDDIHLHTEQSEGNLALIFFHGKQQDRVTGYAQMDKHDAAINQAIASLGPLLADATEKAALTKLVALRESYRNNLLEAMDALELNDKEKAQTIFSTKLLGNLGEMKMLVKQLAKANQDSLSARQAQALAQKNAAEADQSRSRAVIIGLGLAAAIIILWLGRVLVGRISTSA